MESKIEFSDKCLSREEILHYKTKNLSPEELRRIEIHIIDCPLCSEALEEVENLSEAELIDNFEKVKVNVENRRDNRFNWRILISSAAAILIFASASFYLFLNKSPGEELYSNYFNPYPNVILNTRSVSSIDNFSLAMNMYDKRQYQKAIDIFNTITAGNDTIRFYKAITMMELDKFFEADNLLEKKLADKDSYFYFESLWYSALIKIHQEEYKQANEKLTILVNSNSRDYKIKAIELLKKLSRK